MDNENKTIKQITEELLFAQMPFEYTDTASALCQMHIENTCAANMIFAIFEKSLKGDVSAAKLLRDINDDEGPSLNFIGRPYEGMTEAELLMLAGVQPVAEPEEQKPATRKRKKKAADE